MKKNEFGSCPLRSQRDYNEKQASKDVDMMRDTGGTYKHKDLQKPSRSDRKKRSLSEKDPDSKDIKQDPDLKLSHKIIAKELIKLAQNLLETK